MTPRCSRSRLRALAVGICLACAAGCQTRQIDGTLQREVRLTADRPFNRRMGLRLLRVEDDGTVCFRQGTYLHELKVGDPPAAVLGPRVVRSDPASQSAVVTVLDSESLKVYTLGPFEISVLDTFPTPVDILWSPLVGTAWLLRGGPLD